MPPTSCSAKPRPAAICAVRELAQGFEGAWPYLELIARSNAIADPLDDRVVEAYWLGSELLEAVPPGAFARSNEVRFRPRARASAWRWLATKAPDGANPVHAFHVLDVFPGVGLLRGGPSDDVLGVIDRCRIRWGVVRDRIGADLLVDAVPLEWAGGKLRLGPARVETIRCWCRRPRLHRRAGPGRRHRDPLGLGVRAARCPTARRAPFLDQTRAGDRQPDDLNDEDGTPLAGDRRRRVPRSP